MSTEDEEVTTRSAIEDAWPDETTQEPETEPAQEEEHEQPESEEHDGHGERTGEGDEVEDGTEAEKEDDEPEGVPGEAEGGQAATASSEHEKPPVSWNAAAREHWNDLPEDLKAYLHTREAQVQQGMRKHAEGAKRAEAMDRALAPYQQFFQINGGTGATLQGLLQTGQTLQMGTPAQKAQTVATLISTFGVDINALDSILSGEGLSPEQQQQQQIASQVQQQIAPMQQQLSQYQQREMQQQQQIGNEYASEVDTFANDPDNEFYNDVKMDMADILEMAGNRGIDMTLKEAYERACKLSPEVSRVLAQRAQKAVEDKRKAASSVSGAPGGTTTSQAPNTLRGAIEHAWENAGRMS